MSELEGTYRERFYDLLLQWLQEALGHEVNKVVSAETYGTDWAGGTEDGYYSEFNIYIVYEHATLGRQSLTVEGADLKSLWDFVIARAVG